MGIEEEIIDEFFKKLKANKNFPEISRKELNKIWKDNGIISKEEILKIIELGVKDVNQNQGN